MAIAPGLVGRPRARTRRLTTLALMPPHGARPLVVRDRRPDARALPARAGDSSAWTSGSGAAGGRYLWPVALLCRSASRCGRSTVLFTSSTMHTIAHAAWAQVAMLAGAAGFGLAAGKLRNPALGAHDAARVRGLRRCLSSSTSRTDGCSRARRFVHHACGWVLLGGAVVALALALRPRSTALGTAFALTFVVLGSDPLRRSRRRAGLRPPLARRGGRAPMTQWLAVALAASCARAARDGARARDPRSGAARHASSELAAAPAVMRIAFDQPVALVPQSLRVLDARRPVAGRAAEARRGREGDRRAAAAPRGRGG